MTVGTALAGVMLTLMVWVVAVPPWPSLTVMVKVSVLSAALAPVAAALCARCCCGGVGPGAVGIDHDGALGALAADGVGRGVGRIVVVGGGDCARH